MFIIYNSCLYCYLSVSYLLNVYALRDIINVYINCDCAKLDKNWSSCTNVLD